MPFYDFECPDNHITECFFDSISSGKSFMPCAMCQKQARRIISIRGKVSGKQVRVVMNQDEPLVIERPSKNEANIP
jgi:hypothetical protein